MVAYWCHDLFLKIIISLVKIVYLCFYMFTPMCHISDCHVQRVYVCTTEFKERKKERIFIFFHNAHTYKGNWLYSMYMNVGCLYVALRKVNTNTPCETFVRHTEGGCLSCLMLMLCAGRKVTGYGRRPCFNPETWWVQSQKTALNTTVIVIN